MRLIDADALKKQTYPFPCAIGVEHAVTLRAINEAPTIEAAPVVYGEWIWGKGVKGHYGGKFAECSVCGYFERDAPKNYCPNCGAKMEKETAKCNAESESCPLTLAKSTPPEVHTCQGCPYEHNGLGCRYCWIGYQGYE